jgi:Bacterial SH3 domain
MPVIGEAFVGPAVLKIRSDFPLQSATVATVKHGDRLEILAVRRKFYRVRTSNGSEGWTDERQLLAASDMKALRDLAASAAKLPSQGVATTYGTLNIHTLPAIASPSFLQLKENDHVDVLRSVLLPRTDASVRAPLIPPKPKKKVEPKKKKQSKGPAPPMPKPPELPANWLELSETTTEDEPDPEPEKPAPKVDSWSLVRTPHGQSGWVLTRMLTMAIPDEVAQYAEGKRIVSYFPLGFMQDGDEKKTVWLWATTSNSHAPWDFDSFRVFVWSLRRHRYETAHIERNIHGYSPVLLKDVGYAQRGQNANYPGFSICMENKEGQRVRREYVLMTNLVRFAGEQPCEAPPPPVEVKSPAPLPVAAAEPPPKQGWLDGLKRRWRSWRSK